MTIEETDLLFQDICGRLRYGVKAKVYGWDEEKGEVEIPLKIYSINTDGYVKFEANDYDVNYLAVDDSLLYLRPLSSMTVEEENEYHSLCKHKLEVIPDIEAIHIYTYYDTVKSIDWLNKKMFDYRGLIPMGLALEAPEGMYKKD